MANLKLNPDTRMRVFRVEKQLMMPDGTLKRFIRGKIENKEIDLGSMKNPKNTDIVKIEWETPQPKPRGSSIFDNFFDNF